MSADHKDPLLDTAQGHQDGPQIAQEASEPHAGILLAQEQERSKELVAQMARMVRDHQIALDRTLGKTLEGLLEVMDHLQAGIDVSHEKEGLELILKLIQNAFAKQDVIAMDCLGQAFNPDHHHALKEEEGPQGMITSVLQDGYLRNGKVLRVALVGVGRG